MKYPKWSLKKIYFAEMENLPYGEALCALMDGWTITSEKLIYAKKELNDTIMKIQMMSLVLARQKTCSKCITQIAIIWCDR